MDDMTPIPIVALDTPTKEAALALVDELADGCRFYKVGSELFTVVGPSIVHALVERGTEVFLDLKLHDIPNTVAGAVKAAAADIQTKVGSTMEAWRKLLDVDLPALNQQLREPGFPEINPNVSK